MMFFQKFLHSKFLIGSIFLIFIIAPTLAAAQTGDLWTPQRNIPLYHPETEPPILIADQDRTVHAFSSQVIGEAEQERAIVYNQWRIDSGWTVPADIILSPYKAEARILGAYLDPAGEFHVAFFAGDETGARIYYSHAPALNAGHAQYWSEPEMVAGQAIIPENGTIAGDGEGNLVIVFSGKQVGQGFYAVYSEDSGMTWTEPVPIFFTHYDQLWPVYLRVFLSETDRLVAIWSVNDRENHGQAVYFSSLDFSEQQWSQPTILAEINGDNLGTYLPSITEYHGTLFATYYDGSTGNHFLRRSSDLGKTWTIAVAPFPHVGINGPASFVVDSNDDLHIFWAQRLENLGDASVHGVWHSIWNDQSETWGPYESIVKGYKILDKIGFTSFDPETVRAVTSQGNVILLAWRTDRGSRGNGIWYSYNVLNAPELPVSPLPTPAEDSNPTPDTTVMVSQPNTISTPKPVLSNEGGRVTEENPLSTVMTAVIPVSVLIAGLIALARLFSSTRR
jgi:hypothetical protein